MSLERIILDELQMMDLNGVYVLNISLDSALVHVTIKMGKAVIDFNVRENYQYQILSVIYEDVKYENKDYLDQYHDWMTHVIVKIMPVVTAKISEYEKSPQRIEQRESEARIREEALDKKAFELAARERVLGYQEQALDFESQTFEDEQTLEEKQKFRTWLSENFYMIRWLGLAIVIIAVLVFAFSRMGMNTNVSDEGVINHDEDELQRQSDAEIVRELRENFELPLDDEIDETLE